MIGSITSKLSTVLAWRKPDVYFDSDLTNIISQIASLGYINAQSRMTIVGHSHGTIYANLVYRRMMQLNTLEPQQVRLMSIAAFVPIIEGNGGYVTNRNDVPVNAGRAIFSDIKAGTVTIANNEGNSLVRGHDLINQYLRDGDVHGGGADEDADGSPRQRVEAAIPGLATDVSTCQLQLG